ncbi:MAG: RpoL/Rpb11 RNA polymerase subunit family protein [Candidatus Helarchaeales archaeon]
MNVKIITEEGNDTIEVQVFGEGHSLMVGLRHELFKDENVVAAGYSIQHPLSPNPKIYVKTNGKISAREALKKACKSLLAQLDEFEEKFKEAFEKSEEG